MLVLLACFVFFVHGFGCSLLLLYLIFLMSLVCLNDDLRLLCVHSHGISSFTQVNFFLTKFTVLRTL